MSLRMRNLGSKVIDRENIVENPGKRAVTKTVTTKRDALGELGNKLLPHPTNVLKKPEVQNVIKKPIPKPELKKTNVTLKSKTSKTESTVNLKREESVLVKRTIKCLNDKPAKLSYSSKQLVEIVDVDASDRNEPSLVAEYVQDIFQYLRTLETKYPIKKGYLTGHRTTPHMRTLVVNWMVDVHINFQLLLETLHLSVALLDRYLQIHVTVGRETLQLVSVTAMLIASKFEEMYTPDMADFEYICDNAFSMSQIKKMEKEMLCSLKFDLGRPLSIHFLRRYNKIAKVSSDHHNLAKYLLELFLLNNELCCINPSLQAAAACCFSISILNEVSDPSKVWSRTLVHYTSYKYSDIKPVILSLAPFLYKMDKFKHQAIREKYSSSTYGKISLNSKLQGPLVRKLVDLS